jgi:DNA mismatch repair protein MSH5
MHSELMACHELGQLLDEDLTEAEKTELEEAEAVCRTFVAWDLAKDVTNVKDRLAEALDIKS